MALHKTRTFQYRPPKRRAEQMGDVEDSPHRIRLPRAGDGDAKRGNPVIRLAVMLAAIVGLAFVMFALR